MLNLRAFPESTSSVNLLQTHVSFLLVTDRFVYKIKKPVNLGFLDFTTLDRRRFYCHEEVRLNRRLCPDIYLGVVEIRKTRAGIAIDGEGTIIDYAVKMKRLPEERMLHVLLRENNATDSDMRRIAVTIADFHKNAEQSPETASYGSLDSIAYNWQENFRQMENFVGITISRCQLQQLVSWVSDFMDQNRHLFLERIGNGFIRECDGDIHSENICLTDTVCIFDCIEFNKRFRCCDTAADLAFLLMDLDYNGKSFLGDVLLNEYLVQTGDRGMPALLDFYKTYRAVVRGKVESFKLQEPEIPAGEKKEAELKASLYLHLARGYQLRSQLRPTLFITCGLMGSGKSTFAQALALELGLESALSDVVRKEIALSGKDGSEYGEGIYSQSWTDATYRELLVRSERALGAGRSIIVDATFRRSADRTAFRLLADRLDVQFLVIFFICPEQLVKSRLLQREEDPSAPSDGRWELFHRQKDEFQPLQAQEGKTITIDSSHSLLDNIDHLLGQLGLIQCA
ncbi:bifunctional aminoglycoside phosphotransferase/ATP-binding protein [Geotalea sp. SG265]|uniref:bifunctional aminoglycoside phosphotransferase/ATP-binding protein n=1 Tax=Geotalea sp. SG265 TaxID=2922867 RepID=UPI001FAF0BFE|nr:bifunctional aminoglycoside phosphotransferase/ATP-binding protein [Geotalea sp. SG265]